MFRFQDTCEGQCSLVALQPSPAAQKGPCKAFALLPAGSESVGRSPHAQALCTLDGQRSSLLQQLQAECGAHLHTVYMLDLPVRFGARVTWRLVPAPQHQSQLEARPNQMQSTSAGPPTLLDNLTCLQGLHAAALRQRLRVCWLWRPVWLLLGAFGAPCHSTRGNPAPALWRHVHGRLQAASAFDSAQTHCDHDALMAAYSRLAAGTLSIPIGLALMRVVPKASAQLVCSTGEAAFVHAQRLLTWCGATQGHV